MKRKAITNRRLSYMDIAKGFGILCVIAGHMGNEIINRFVFSFHMPLFFIISGYFLSQRNTPKELLYKRCKQLLPPYIFTCFCVLALCLFKNSIGILIGMKSINDLFFDAAKWFYASLYGAGSNHDIPFRIIQIGAIWFLLAMIFGSYIVKQIETKKNPVLWLMIVCWLGYFSSKVLWLPWSIQSAMTASVFIYMGVLTKRYHIIEQHANIVFPAAMVLWITEIVKGNPCIGIVINQYPNGAFDFIGGGCGALCVIIIVKYLSDNLIPQTVLAPIKWLGKNSLTILCLHLIELNMIPWQALLKLFGFTNHLLIPIFLFKLIWSIGGTMIINSTKLKCIFSK